MEYASVNASLPFYPGERVWLFEVPRELEFAEPHARAAALLSPRHLVAVVRQRGRAWVLGPSGPTGRRMQALGLRRQPRLVWRDQVLGFVTPDPPGHPEGSPARSRPALNP